MKYTIADLIRREGREPGGRAGRYHWQARVTISSPWLNISPFIIRPSLVDGSKISAYAIGPDRIGK